MTTRLNGSLKWVVVMLAGMLVGVVGTWEATQQGVISKLADRQLIVLQTLSRKEVTDSALIVEVHRIGIKVDTLLAWHYIRR